MSKATEFGLLLPHFTKDCSVSLLYEGARVAEGLGFDSLWVRDHLFISPDHREHGGITDPGILLEPTLSLAALGAITSNVKLGTAVLTPHRHPVKVAQLFGSLDYMSGGRAIMGIGAGWDAHEFAAVDRPFDERLGMVRETVEICRLGWREPDFSYQGNIYVVPWACVNPQPVNRELPIWYGGLSFRAVELAVELGQGWIPSRIPFDRLAVRIQRAKELLGDRSESFTFAAMPQTALGDTAEDALAEFNIEKIIDEALHRKPVSGGRGSMTLGDLEGYMIWGNATDICEYVESFLEIGVSHVVFDMRSSFSRFLENVKLLGREVLPQFR